MDLRGLVFRTCATAAFGLFSLQATAASVTFNYTESFGSVPPDGPAPYATATFDDGGTAGSVTLTMSVAGTVDGADVTAMFFNLDPTLDPTTSELLLVTAERTSHSNDQYPHGCRCITGRAAMDSMTSCLISLHRQEITQRDSMPGKTWSIRLRVQASLPIPLISSVSQALVKATRDRTCRLLDSRALDLIKKAATGSVLFQCLQQSGCLARVCSAWWV